MEIFLKHETNMMAAQGFYPDDDVPATDNEWTTEESYDQSMY